MNKQESIGVGVGILVGLALGCAVGLLVAPKSGIETREYIVDTAKKVKDKVVRATEELKK